MPNNHRPTPGPARNFTSTPAFAMALAGMPQERLAKIAARRSFVGLKECFMRAVADLEGSRAQWLQQQVRQTHQPVDLWLLRGAVLAALRNAEQCERETELQTQIDSVFSDGPSSLPPVAW